MADNESIPAQWTPHLLRWQQKTGVELTYRAMALKLGMDHMTLWRVLNGKGRSTSANISKLADALGVTPAEVRELRGSSPEDPFELPPEASVLTSGQRAAVMGVVRQFIAAHESAASREAGNLADKPGKAHTLPPEERWRQHEYDLAARANPDPKDEGLHSRDGDEE